jgi:hypothetical protein
MRRSFSRTVVKHRFVRGGARVARRLRDTLRYIQHRPLGAEEGQADRRLFTARDAGITQTEALALLLARAGRRVAYHRLILSPGRPVEDLEHWTRLVLADLGRHLDQHLQWVAAVHRNTDHPHVHVLLAGMGERRGEGRAVPVILRPEEYALLRDAGDRHSRELTRADRALDAAIEEELLRAVADLLPPIDHEREDALPSYPKHLHEQSEQRGAPGRDATRGR